MCRKTQHLNPSSSVFGLKSVSIREGGVNRASLLQGGKRGEPVIVASHSEKSPLVQFVSDQVEDLEMPPVPKRDKFPALTKPEIARLRAWIDQGAIWPEEAKIRVSSP